MDWMQFVAALTSSLAWPIAVVAMVLILKTPLSDIIPLIRSLKWGKFSIDLGEKLREVETDIATEASPSEPPVTASDMPPIQARLALDAPRGAILSSWLTVEDTIQRLVSEQNLSVEHLVENQQVQMRVLRERGVIDQLTYSTYMKLMEVRNKVAHLTDSQLDSQEALSMIASCSWLVARLEDVRKHKQDLSEVPGRRQY
ncbi:hypothetical protein [Pseudomonas mosselii]|uniref:hypothetical protein n=1 Tax=Pseudomonas mosselii TaxID=78327 RepID=UPI001E37EAEF|nr:hypothetical protein [Pseudomonas mosselii]WJR28870.1 hypothetical protein LU678_002060 [Pseudomonas mosselii]